MQLNLAVLEGCCLPAYVGRPAPAHAAVVCFRDDEPRWLAVALACGAVVLWIAAVWLPGWRELLIVCGLALAALAGGVLNWDRRGGH